MKIKNLESTSLSAINKLVEFEMPFAAASLCYVMIERCLKLNLIQNRKKLTQKEVDICAKTGKSKLRFKDFAQKDDSIFINEYINTIPLGGLEIIFRIQKNKIKDSRNKLIHSGFYIESEKNLPYEKRNDENWKHYRIAKEHLIYCSENCFNMPIIENSKLIEFKS